MSEKDICGKLYVKSSVNEMFIENEIENTEEEIIGLMEQYFDSLAEDMDQICDTDELLYLAKPFLENIADLKAKYRRLQTSYENAIQDTDLYQEETLDCYGIKKPSALSLQYKYYR